MPPVAIGFSVPGQESPSTQSTGLTFLVIPQKSVAAHAAQTYAACLAGHV